MNRRKVRVPLLCSRPGSIAEQKANRCGWPTSVEMAHRLPMCHPFLLPETAPNVNPRSTGKASGMRPQPSLPLPGKREGAGWRCSPANPLAPNAAGLPGGCLRSSLPAGQSPRAPTPPACPADAYARRYPPASAPGLLAPGCSPRSSLPAGQSPRAPMPPACPVDAYARR